MTKKTNTGAPEFDDHTESSRPQGLLKKGLEIVGLHSKVLEADLLENPVIIDVPARRANVCPNYDNGELVSFTENTVENIPARMLRRAYDIHRRKNFYVTHKFTKQRGRGISNQDEYCVIQQADGEKNYTLLKLVDPVHDRREPIVPIFFKENYTLIPGGIEFQGLNSSERFRRDHLRSKKD